MTSRADLPRLGASLGLLGTILERDGQTAFDRMQGRSAVTPVRDNELAGRCVNSPGRGQPLLRGVDVPNRSVGGQFNTPESFWARTEWRDGCLVWTGLTDDLGYGRVGWDRRVVLAHRLAFYLTHGRWPEPDMVLRHLCNNPPCVVHVVEGTLSENSLDAVAAGTHKEARKTHCKNGHPYDDENTIYRDGHRSCRICRREWGRKHDRKRPSGSMRQRLARERKEGGAA